MDLSTHLHWPELRPMSAVPYDRDGRILRIAGACCGDAMLWRYRSKDELAQQFCAYDA